MSAMVAAPCTPLLPVRNGCANNSCSWMPGSLSSTAKPWPPPMPSTIAAQAQGRLPGACALEDVAARGRASRRSPSAGPESRRTSCRRDTCARSLSRLERCATAQPDGRQPVARNRARATVAGIGADRQQLHLLRPPSTAWAHALASHRYQLLLGQTNYTSQEEGARWSSLPRAARAMVWCLTGVSHARGVRSSHTLRAGISRAWKPGT
jgi:hypothetical protein